MKIVKNACYGGFGLSQEALLYLSKITGKTLDQCETDYIWGDDDCRATPELIQVVEKLGPRANDDSSNLVIVEIPDDVKGWYIDEYNGWESIEEVHRKW